MTYIHEVTYILIMSGYNTLPTVPRVFIVGLGAGSLNWAENLLFGGEHARVLFVWTNPCVCKTELTVSVTK